MVWGQRVGELAAAGMSGCVFAGKRGGWCTSSWCRAHDKGSSAGWCSTPEGCEECGEGGRTVC